MNGLVGRLIRRDWLSHILLAVLAIPWGLLTFRVMNGDSEMTRKVILVIAFTGAFATAQFFPSISTFALFIVSCFFPSGWWEWGIVNFYGVWIDLVDAGLFIVGVGVLLRRIRLGGIVSLKVSIVDGMLVIYLLVILWSVLASINVTDISTVGKDLVWWVRLVAIYLIGYRLFFSLELANRHKLQLALNVIVGTASLIAVIAMVELLLSPKPLLTYIPGFRAPWATVSEYSSPMMKRVFATFGSPIPLGAFFTMVVPLCFFLFEYAKRPRTIILSLASTLIVLTSVATASRGTLMILAVILLGCCLRFKRGAMLLILLSLGVITGVALVSLRGYSMLDYAWARFSEMSYTTDINVVHRLRSYDTVLNILKVHPWLGLGLGAGGNTEYLNYRASGTELLNTPDNGFLKVAADSGLLGLTAMIGLMASVTLSLFILYQRIRDPMTKSFVFAVLLAVIGFIAQNFVFDALLWRNVTLVFWILVGLGMRAALDGQAQAQLAGCEPMSRLSVSDVHASRVNISK